MCSSPGEEIPARRADHPRTPKGRRPITRYQRNPHRPTRRPDDDGFKKTASIFGTLLSSQGADTTGQTLTGPPPGQPFDLTHPTHQSQAPPPEQNPEAAEKISGTSPGPPEPDPQAQPRSPPRRQPEHYGHMTTNVKSEPPQPPATQITPHTVTKPTPQPHPGHPRRCSG